MRFPGFPDSAGSALLVGLVYATPLLVALVGTVAPVASRRGRVLTVSMRLAGAFLVASFVASGALADVEFMGHG